MQLNEFSWSELTYRTKYDLNEIQMAYHFICKTSPKACSSSLMGFSRKNGVFSTPNFINILQNESWFEHWFSIMNKHWDLFINWAILEKKRTLHHQTFYYVVVFYPLDFESPYYPVNKRAIPNSKKLNISLRLHDSIWFDLFPLLLLLIKIQSVIFLWTF